MSVVKTSNGGAAGPYSTFQVRAELIYVSTDATGYNMKVRAYISVSGGTNGFRGTNVSTSWAGTVALYNTGTYADVTSGQFHVNFGSTYTSSSFSAQYTAGSGKTYKSTAGAMSYTVPRPTYTVTYNANGGENAPANQTKTYGINLALSSTIPTKAGHRFKGWATSLTGDPSYYPGGIYSANAAITLYAVWQVATLIQMNFAWNNDYYISNDSNGKAFLCNIAIPYTLVTDSENASSKFLYDVYYSYNGTLKQASDGMITVPSGVTSGLMILRSEDIKQYIKSGNTSAINLVVKTYTSEVSDDTISTYNLSIDISGYSKIAVKEIYSYRNKDNTLSLKVIMSYPVSYDARKCVPEIYYNEMFLGATPSSAIVTLGSSSITENLREYNYLLDATKTSGSGKITVVYDDGLFEVSKSRAVTSTYSDQTIYINKNGSIEGFEFIEQDKPEVCFYRDGTVQSFEFGEGTEQSFVIDKTGQTSAFMIIEK